MNNADYEAVSKQLEIYSCKLQEESNAVWDEDPTSNMIDVLGSLAAELESLSFKIAKLGDIYK